MTSHLLLSALPLMVIPSALCVNGDLLRSYLPGAVDGFLPEEGQSIFCVASNMTYIYDGGYLTYVNQGTVMALQQFYAKGESAYFSVTLHLMNSRENASRIVGYFRGILSSLPTLRDAELGEGGFECSDSSVSYLYFWQDRLFVALEGTRDLSIQAMRLSGGEILRKALPEESLCAGLGLGILCLGSSHLFRRGGGHRQVP